MNSLLLDFSLSKIRLPKAENEWQQEIINFIDEYQQNDTITVHTSGSTGTPKAIKLPKVAMIQSAHMTGDFLDLKKGSSALLCMPVKYIAGKMMVVRAMELGWKLHCVEPKSSISYPQTLDFGALTPMQAEKTFFDANENLTSSLKLKKIILGGAKVSKRLEEKLKSVNSKIYETYGMTETITHIAMRELNQQAWFEALQGIEIETDDRSCLVIKTPYFPDKIITNDVVEIKDGKRFKVIGRVDNIINSGGLKINPEALEELLKPYISAPFIIHYKHDILLGQRLVLVVEGDKNIGVHYPHDLIPKNQQPKEIVYIHEFPRTISGKIIRKDINL